MNQEKLNQEKLNQENMSWQKWLKENWPNVKALDHDWTMERYDYPQYVRDGITENWIKLNDENGGTWHEPNYHKENMVLLLVLPPVLLVMLVLVALLVHIKLQD